MKRSLISLGGWLKKPNHGGFSGRGKTFTNNGEKVTGTTVFLTSIYDKSERNTITDKELEQIFKLLP